MTEEQIQYILDMCEKEWDEDLAGDTGIDKFPLRYLLHQLLKEVNG